MLCVCGATPHQSAGAACCLCVQCYPSPKALEQHAVCVWCYPSPERWSSMCGAVLPLTRALEQHAVCVVLPLPRALDQHAVCVVLPLPRALEHHAVCVVLPLTGTLGKHDVWCSATPQQSPGAACCVCAVLPLATGLNGIKRLFVRQRDSFRPGLFIK
jgi:hypothetical protein